MKSICFLVMKISGYLLFLMIDLYEDNFRYSLEVF